MKRSKRNTYKRLIRDTWTDSWPLRLSFGAQFFAFCMIPLLGTVLSGCGTSEGLARVNFKMAATVDSLALKTNVQNDAYVIRQGDVVTISVHGYPEMDTTATVGESGTIPAKLVGDQQAAGLSRSELAEQLHAKLSVYISSQFSVTITVLNRMVQNVTVLGEVTRQGIYPIAAGTSLLQVLATAGGSTSDSDLRHVRIFPSGQLENPVEADISQTSLGIIKDVPLVKPGDIVYVPKEENVIRELSGFFRDAIFLFSFFSVFR